MNLQQLETELDREDREPLNTRFLSVIAHLNPILAEDEMLLLSYYKQVRATWSTSAIRNLQKATEIKLTNKLNRCRFAIHAAKLQLQLMSSEAGENDLDLPPQKRIAGNSPIESKNKSITPMAEEVFPVEEVESQLQIAQEQIKLLELQLQEKELQIESRSEQLKQAENFSVLLLTNRLLAPGLPLNGTEESPAMRVLGSPKTLTELEANYRELLKREHPDVSSHTPSEAIARFSYLRSLYRITREHWQELKPTASITQEEREKRMIAPVPFVPESFWLA